jgi:selenide,water dikinase
MMMMMMMLMMLLWLLMNRARVCSFSQVFAGVRLVHAECVGVDRAKKLVLLRGGRPPIPYDVLSINIGSAPQVADVSAVPAAAVGAAGAEPDAAAVAACVVPVKPIDGFGKRWAALLARVAATDFAAPGQAGAFVPLRLCVVGGGAGGVELALAMQHRLTQLLAARGLPPHAILRVSLVSRATTVLPSHSARVRGIFTRTLKARGVALVAGREVVRARPHCLELSDGASVAFDECVWCTQGSAQGWVQRSGFDVDAGGFLQVNTHLQSTNSPDVFGAGDIASIAGYPRPKAGVFAVMAGMPLAVNLRKRLEGDRKLDAYVPQVAFLGLLGLGDGGCVASRGRMALQGTDLWALKDWIDRKWMHVYTAGLPDMAAMHAHGAGKDAATTNLVAAAAGPAALAALAAQPMRCGGCGAKVGATTLARAMKQVRETRLWLSPRPVLSPNRLFFPLASSSSSSSSSCSSFSSTFSTSFSSSMRGMYLQIPFLLAHARRFRRWWCGGPKC